jgi:hypothetical protein
MMRRRRMKIMKMVEITPSLHSLPPEDLPSLGDPFSQQTGISVGACWMKHPQTGTWASFSPPLQSSLALVSPDQ